MVTNLGFDNLAFLGDWSNLDLGQRDYSLRPGEYDMEAGMRKLQYFLADIARPTRRDMFTPIHQVYGHYEFLREEGFNIVLCPIVASTLSDTTDSRIKENALDLIERYQMGYFCIGSGDGPLVVPILEAAKAKGIKVAVVYGSERSLSRQIPDLVDEYPPGHPKEGEKMLHLFFPIREGSKQQT